MTGLEPAHGGITTHCLNQLGYTHHIVLTNNLPSIIIKRLEILKSKIKWRKI